MFGSGILPWKLHFLKLGTGPCTTLILLQGRQRSLGAAQSGGLSWPDGTARLPGSPSPGPFHPPCLWGGHRQVGRRAGTHPGPVSIRTESLLRHPVVFSCPLMLQHIPTPVSLRTPLPWAVGPGGGGCPRSSLLPPSGLGRGSTGLERWSVTSSCDLQFSEPQLPHL